MYLNNKAYVTLVKVIEEAVHSNHSEFNKNNSKNAKNRKMLADDIRLLRKDRDIKKNKELKNKSDNAARAFSNYGVSPSYISSAKSMNGKKYRAEKAEKRLKGGLKNRDIDVDSKKAPRIFSSAKK